MNHQYTPKDVVHFYEQIDTSAGMFECWLWTGGKNPAGYGRFCARGKSFLAHRVSYELAFGEFPQEMLVCHHCDVPSCCNPAHLFLGTDADNVKDMRKKGRRSQPPHSYGENHPLSKLTYEQVAEIRRLYAIGDKTLVQLGKRFGVSESQISHIVRGEQWR